VRIRRLRPSASQRTTRSSIAGTGSPTRSIESPETRRARVRSRSTPIQSVGRGGIGDDRTTRGRRSTPTGAAGLEVLELLVGDGAQQLVALGTTATTPCVGCEIVTRWV